MKEKLQALKKKLNPKVAVISGAVVISTSLGTCHLISDEAEAPAADQEAPEDQQTVPAIPEQAAEEKEKEES